MRCQNTRSLVRTDGAQSCVKGKIYLYVLAANCGNISPPAKHLKLLSEREGARVGPDLQFIHRLVSKSIIESTCMFCNAMIAASPKKQMLEMAERCHKCPVKNATPSSALPRQGRA